MAQAARIAGPGLIINRHAKNGKIEMAVDPSPDGFITACRRENARLKVLIVPGNGAIEPIEIKVKPKALVFKFESAEIPRERLADLEALITEEQDVHVVIEYTPQKPELPFSEHHVDADGFVTDPTEYQLQVPAFLDAEISFLFASVDTQWFFGYKMNIGGQVRTRRVNVHLDGYATIVGCMGSLHDAVLSELEADDKRLAKYRYREKLAQYLTWRLEDAALRAQDGVKDMDDAMSGEIHLPAEFMKEKSDEASADPLAEPETIVIAAPGTKRTNVKVTLWHGESGWGYKFTGVVGNYAFSGESCDGGFDTRGQAMEVFSDNVASSLNEIEITGTADQRRSMERWRDILKEQVQNRVKEMILASGEESKDATDEVPFEEDPTPGK